ncbi:MAG: hypothetical protein PVG91_11805 [Gammaproteobacteria bacterium]|jgi:hypothetical protein
MSANYLEQLAAEWYEYSGYFVRRNVPVGPRPGGGFDSELTILSVHLDQRKVVQVEPSMDAHSWEKREARFRARFDAGRRFIPDLLGDFEPDAPIRQIALIGLGSRLNHPTIGGGEVLTLPDFLAEIIASVGKVADASGAVPQQYPILRTLQFVAENRRAVMAALLDQDPRQMGF